MMLIFQKYFNTQWIGLPVLELKQIDKTKFVYYFRRLYAHKLAPTQFEGYYNVTFINALMAFTYKFFTIVSYNY